jgi:hypothetical protein
MITTWVPYKFKIFIPKKMLKRLEKCFFILYLTKDDETILNSKVLMQEGSRRKKITKLLRANQY